MWVFSYIFILMCWVYFYYQYNYYLIYKNLSCYLVLFQYLVIVIDDLMDRFINLKKIILNLEII